MTAFSALTPLAPSSQPRADQQSQNYLNTTGEFLKAGSPSETDYSSFSSCFEKMKLAMKQQQTQLETQNLWMKEVLEKRE